MSISVNQLAKPTAGQGTCRPRAAGRHRVAGRGWRGLFTVVACWSALVCSGSLAPVSAAGRPPREAMVRQAQAKVVKIFGAGGPRGLEAYQTGVLISPTGHVLTVWSYVLDTDRVRVVLDDGQMFLAELLGADPRHDVAVLKIDARDLPYFDWHTPAELVPGDRVLALSNAFGVAQRSEAVTVQQGVLATLAPLTARRGVFTTPFAGPVMIVDAITNNPGAAGGALTNVAGVLAGLLGKELRNGDNDTWVNFAVPLAALIPTIDRLLTGLPAEDTNLVEKSVSAPLTNDQLGLVLVPDVLERTPAFIDLVQPESAAARAGLAADDLILSVDGTLVGSCAEVGLQLKRRARGEPVTLLVQRGQTVLEVVLSPTESKDP